MKIEGHAHKTVEEFKKSLKKGDSGGLWTIPKEGNMVVRFLDDSPSDWFLHSQYWHDGSMWPKIVGEKVPEGANVTKRYLAWVLRSDRDDHHMIPLILPKSVAENVLAYFEMSSDTMLWQREYVIRRSGTGLDTSYTVMAQGESNFNPAPYEERDSYVDLLTAERLRCESKSAENDDIDDDLDDDDEVVEAPPAKPAPTPRGRARQKGPKVEPDLEDPSEGVQVYTEDDLFPSGEYRTDYTLSELRHISVEYETDLAGIAADVWDIQEDDAGALVSAILDAQSAATRGVPPLDDDEDDPIDFAAMSVRELRQAAVARGVDPSRMKKEEIVEALSAL